MIRRYASVIQASLQFGRCDQLGRGYMDNLIVTAAQALKLLHVQRSVRIVEDGSSIGMPRYGFSTVVVWIDSCTSAFGSPNCVPEICESPYNPQILARPVDLPSAGIRNDDLQTREDLGCEIVGARIRSFLDRRQDRIGKHDIRMQYASSHMLPLTS